MGKFTLEYLLDCAEIRELSVKYNEYANAADGENCASLYTEDGEFWSKGYVYKGREELARVASAAREIIHITADPVIEIDGDEATQTSIKIVAHRAPDRSSITFVTTGKYTDKLVRTPEGWRFKRRESENDLDPEAFRKAVNMPSGRLGG